MPAFAQRTEQRSTDLLSLKFTAMTVSQELSLTHTQARESWCRISNGRMTTAAVVNRSLLFGVVIHSCIVLNTGGR